MWGIGADFADERAPGRTLPAFWGLGLSLEAVLFRAARAIRRLKRPGRVAPVMAVRAAVFILSGIARLVTLRRLTRAG
jgi:hypothetical protein